MKIKSNCKINLNLKIVGAKNGYHLLDSIFVPISIYDYIFIRKSKEDNVIGMDINKEDNIIYKALKLFKDEYKIDKCVTIRIKKNIPMQAGLGGGSADAAFTLLLLNKYFKTDLTKDELLNLALKLGSDVPFFIINKPSNVTGRGEIIKPIDNFKEIYGLIIFDKFNCSTKEIFKVFDDNQLFNIENKNDNEYINDLEKAVNIIDVNNRIISIKKDLNENGSYLSLMSGSGGAVFGLFNNYDVLKKTYNILKKKYYFVHIFRSL